MQDSSRPQKVPVVGATQGLPPPGQIQLLVVGNWVVLALLLWASLSLPCGGLKAPHSRWPSLAGDRWAGLEQGGGQGATGGCG